MLAGKKEKMQGNLRKSRKDAGLAKMKNEKTHWKILSKLKKGANKRSS